MSGIQLRCIAAVATWALMIFAPTSAWAAMVGRDHLTPLVVAPAGKAEIDSITEIIKDNIDADTDQKLVDQLNKLLRQESVDSPTRQRTPPFTVDHPLVQELKREQVRLKKFYQSLQDKDGKCVIWKVTGEVQKDANGQEVIQKVKSELLLIFIDGDVKQQKLFRQNSRKEWMNLGEIENYLNPIRKTGK